MNTTVPKTSPGAIWSLVLGILGLICFGPFAAIPAVICGHIAMGNIKRSVGTLAGEGQALAGLIMGYIGIALAILMIPLLTAIALPAFAKARERAQTVMCMSNLRLIYGAKQMEEVKSEIEEGQPIDPASLRSYFTDKILPVCPAGGTYEIGPAGELPTCSIEGHQIQDE